MLDANTLIPIFAEKLLATGDFTKAVNKIAWVAYKAGLEDALKPPIAPPKHFHHSSDEL